mmetsp:Transcript_25869/g.33939  ORF Transcript_25869/g.33939 Transcript_25869/m.33939 type:complete len:357 (+) Transcript_25869:203-1273(+)|eukprot:CAMPEP_0117744912 /NCGR_PEP_ID=MMETSP0947-20121206/7045_1 /TAXON_ID=44440 /ORGANISM="Chattonella subsalsa, Strain CCMP2191" /LENGTH=356 /DNA_ID=CAMNT_0005561959 /DNA_START=111 /DNA_END=1181 /DNA_ORIENTATION=+
MKFPWHKDREEESSPEPQQRLDRAASSQLFDVSPYSLGRRLSLRKDTLESRSDLDLGVSVHSVQSHLSASSERCCDFLLEALQNPFVQFIIAVLILSTIASVFLIFHKHDVYLAVQFLTHKWYAPMVFAGVFVFYVMLCFPCTFMEFLAGYVFSFWVALLVCTAGKFIGSMLSYLFGRYLGSEWVRDHLLSRYHIWKGLQLAQQKRPWQVTFLIRLGYIPLMLKNYGLAVMHCPFHIFALASLSMGIPFTLAINHAGFISKELIKAAETGGKHIRSSWDVVMLIIGSTAVILFLIMTRFYTKRALAMIEKDELGDFYDTEENIDDQNPAKYNISKEKKSNDTQKSNKLDDLPGTML